MWKCSQLSAKNNPETMKETHRMKKEKIKNMLLYFQKLLQKECSSKTWSKFVLAAVVAYQCFSL